LIDIAEPFEEYNLFRFKRDFKLSFNEIQKANKVPILVGGTGLYLSAILQSYYLPEIDEKEKNDLSPLSLAQLKNLLLKLKPKQHNITDLQDRERMIQAILVERSREKKQSAIPEYKSLTIGIKPERNETKTLITTRLKARLDNGMIEEVRTLLSRGITREKMNYFGLEYKYVTLFINGNLNYNDMFQKLNSAIHSFAKRQMTWFRKMEKEGVAINWFPPGNYSEIKNFVKEQFTDAENSSK
jgi:tRNA dimethylallyltransferase